MSFESVSEESNGAEVSTNGRTHSKDTDAMCISPGSSGRTSRNKNHDRDRTPKHKSKKRKRDRSPSVKRSGRSRSRDRSRRDRDSRGGMDSSRRRSNERKSSRKFSRRSRSRSPVHSSSRSSRRRNGGGKSKRRRRSTSTSSSDEDRSITERQQGVTLSSLLSHHKSSSKSKKEKKSRRRRGSSSTSTSSEDTTKNQEASAAQPAFMDQTALQYMNYMNQVQAMIVPMAQPPPSSHPISIGVPPFAAPPPVPPAPPLMSALANIHMPPPPVPSIPSLPPGVPPPLPPLPPLPPTNTGGVAGMQPRQQQHVPPVAATSSLTGKMGALPLPNVGRRRNYDQPVVLNKERRVIDYSNEWGSGFVEKYDMVEIVGEGTYGQVYKANEKITGDQVALKKVRLENEKEGFPITAVREIKILRQLNHPNVVKLHDIVTDKQTASDLRSDRVNFYLVFEYVDHDLTGILDAASNNLIPSFTSEQVSGMFKQLLMGLEYCHNANFLHRDIKCSNILVNNRGELKIADFGLARLYQEDQERLYTNRVITLWYRPPELLLGEEHYGPHVDVWSVGCILAEFFIKKALFMANTEMKQLDIVSRLCGTPTPETWPDVEKLPLYHTFRPKRIYFRSLKEEFDTLMPAGALDLLDKLLTMDPKRRPTASEALKHYWVKHVNPALVPPPTLPQNMDCHEMWSKRQKKKKEGGYTNGGQQQQSSQSTRPPPQQQQQTYQQEVRVKQEYIVKQEYVVKQEQPPSSIDASSAVNEAIARYMREPSDSSQLRAALQNISESAASDVLEQLKRTLGPSASHFSLAGRSAREHILALLDGQLGGARPTSYGSSSMGGSQAPAPAPSHPAQAPSHASRGAPPMRPYNGIAAPAPYQQYPPYR